MLQKVEPAERGIPKFKNIYVDQLKVKDAKKAINASGLEQSTLENFHLSNVSVNAGNAGEINYGSQWELKNVVIMAKDNSSIAVKNSTDVSP